MIMLSILLIPGVLLACIGLISSIGVLDGTTSIPDQPEGQPKNRGDTLQTVELVRFH